MGSRLGRDGTRPGRDRPGRMAQVPAGAREPMPASGVARTCKRRTTFGSPRASWDESGTSRNDRAVVAVHPNTGRCSTAYLNSSGSRHEIQRSLRECRGKGGRRGRPARGKAGRTRPWVISRTPNRLPPSAARIRRLGTPARRWTRERASDRERDEPLDAAGVVLVARSERLAQQLLFRVDPEPCIVGTATVASSRRMSARADEATCDGASAAARNASRHEQLERPVTRWWARGIMTASIVGVDDHGDH